MVLPACGKNEQKSGKYIYNCLFISRALSPAMSSETVRKIKKRYVTLVDRRTKIGKFKSRVLNIKVNFGCNLLKNVDDFVKNELRREIILLFR